MTHRKYFRWLWLICIVVMVSISCSLLGNVVENQINKTISTQVESVVTNADVQSIATQVDLNSIVTQIDVGSLATQINPDEIFNTVETMIPGEGTSEPPPPDVPIMPANSDLVTSKTSIEFTVQNSIKEVTDYYEKEMPAKGWTKVQAESKVESDVTTLVFTKDNRKATITIEEDIIFGGTSVTIDIVQS
jgi:hypothetical protein